MIEKNGSIVISNFQKGAAQSPVFGAGSVKGCNIFEEPGILKIGPRMSEDAGRINDTGYHTLTGLPIADVVFPADSTPGRVILTETGEVYANNSSDLHFLISSSTKFGYDACYTPIKIYTSGVYTGNTYSGAVISYKSGSTGFFGVVALDRVGNSILDGMNLYSSGLTTTQSIKMVNGSDGYIYFTNGNTIGNITLVKYETTTATFSLTVNTNVLDLEPGNYATTICEFGKYLAIGSHRGATIDQKGQIAGANIYLWDRTSSSFNLPIRVQENGINALISKDNILYVSAGVYGNIYYSDGVNCKLFKSIPFTSLKNGLTMTTVRPNSFSFNQRGNLLVGLSSLSDGTPNNTTKNGVWEISLSDTGAPCYLAFYGSDGNTGNLNKIDIGSITTSYRDKVSVGMMFNNANPKLYTTDYKPYTNYTACYESELHLVGSRNNRKSYDNVEILLAKKMSSSQGIKISYRKNLSDTYTELARFEYNELENPDEISYLAPAPISDAELLQVKIELTQGASTDIGTANINLINVIIS